MLNVYEELIRKNGSNLRSVPESERTEDLCLLAVSLNPKAVRHLPGPLKKRDFYLRVLAENPAAYFYLPTGLSDSAFNLEFLRLNPLNLRFLDPSDREDALCDYAVANSPYALAYIPTEKRSAEQCERALFGSFSASAAKAASASPDLAWTHCGRFGLLPLVPKKNRNLTMAYAIKHKNPHSTMFLEDQFIMSDFCNLQKTLPWHELPEFLLSQIVESDPTFFPKIPEFKRSLALFEVLFLKHPYHFFLYTDQYSKKALPLSESFRATLASLTANFISEALANQKTRAEKIAENPALYLFLPRSWQTRALYNLFAEKYGYPTLGKDDSEIFWLKAVNRFNLDFLPEVHHSFRFFSHRLLAYIPGDWA